MSRALAGWLLAALAVLAAGLAAPPAHAGVRLRLQPTSQFDLANGAALRVRVHHARPRDLLLTATVSHGGRTLALAAPRRVHLRHARTIVLPVAAGARAALGQCASERLDVAVRARGGDRLGAIRRRLRPDPPACGRFFSPRSVWNATLPADAPIDHRSPALVAELLRQLQVNFADHFYPTINTTSYSAPVYTVPARQHRVRVRIVGSRAAWGRRLQAQLDRGVPIPHGAQPANGADGHIVIWQPATDTMWELWRASQQRGQWVASWGGRLDGASRSPGYFHDSSGIEPGATATSLPLAGGLITFGDLLRGRIGHALAMAIPHSRGGAWAVPAQRTDGNVRSVDAIPAGAHFRLDPSLDIDALGLPPFTAMLAHAAQRYGIVVRDTSPVVTLYAQAPRPGQANPWPAAITPSTTEVLRRFPWSRLQVVRMQLRGYSGKHIAD